VAHHLAPLDLGHVGTGPGIEGGEVVQGNGHQRRSRLFTRAARRRNSRNSRKMSCLFGVPIFGSMRCLSAVIDTLTSRTTSWMCPPSNLRPRYSESACCWGSSASVGPGLDRIAVTLSPSL